MNHLSKWRQVEVKRQKVSFGSSIQEMRRGNKKMKKKKLLVTLSQENLELPRFWFPSNDYKWTWAIVRSFHPRKRFSRPPRLRNGDREPDPVLEFCYRTLLWMWTVCGSACLKWSSFVVTRWTVIIIDNARHPGIDHPVAINMQLGVTSVETDFQGGEKVTHWAMNGHFVWKTRQPTIRSVCYGNQNQELFCRLTEE